MPVRRLNTAFYQREDVLKISKELLGKILVTNFNNQRTSGIIVETEAYRGPEDKACHAYNNRYTKRTEPMFGPGGHAYVYLCYGIHHLFNVVTAKKDMPHAILIRAVEPFENIELMMQRRSFKDLRPQLTAGPGVMSRALGITTGHTGMNICENHSTIWIEDHGKSVETSQIISSSRVGVDYAEECAEWNWRFRIAENRWTSKAK